MHPAPCDHPPSGCGPCADRPPVCLPSGLSLLLLPPRVLAAAVYSTVNVVQRTLDGAYDDGCPQCHGQHGKDEPCCGIPEGKCPDACVCRIYWQGCPGDSFKYRIQVTNTSKTKREFVLKAMPFPCTEAEVKVAPDKQTLAQDESFQAEASFTIPDDLVAGCYVGRIKVIGAYEQYIQVCLTVGSRHACCCHIEQGDIPKRVRAHHWYHHFQCEETCFEPAAKAG